MSGQEAFSVELDGTRAQVALRRPAGEGPAPVVLVCDGLTAPAGPAHDLLDEIGSAMVKRGAAVATLGAATGESPPPRVGDLTRRSAAGLHGLVGCEALDLERIGVLGYGLGAITACCLAGRSDQIARLALLSPLLPEVAAALLTTESERGLARRLGLGEVPQGFFDDLTTLDATGDAARYGRPTLILHGAADRQVDPGSALAYRDAIAAAGHPTECLLVAMGDHVYADASARALCLDRLSAFFCAPLKAAAPERP